MQNKIEQQYFNENADQIMKWNELIGRFCGMEPKIEYSVGTDKNSIRYSPESDYYPTSYLQQKECERYIQEQEHKSFVAPGSLQVLKHEWWPWFNQDWEMLMFTFEKIRSLDTALYIYTIQSPSVWIEDQSFKGKGMICIEHSSEKQTPKIAAYKCLVRFVEYHNNVNKK